MNAMRKGVLRLTYRFEELESSSYDDCRAAWYGMFGASNVPIDFRWASLRGITRNPVDGAAGALFSPVTSKLVPPDFLRANAFSPNGGIEVVML